MADFRFCIANIDACSFEYNRSYSSVVDQVLVMIGAELTEEVNKRLSFKLNWPLLLEAVFKLLAKHESVFVDIVLLD